MIHRQFNCNICHSAIQWHPAQGLLGTTLFMSGPVGAEGSVLREGDHFDPPHSEIHLCQRCVQGLAAFFENRKGNVT